MHVFVRDFNVIEIDVYNIMSYIYYVTTLTSAIKSKKGIDTSFTIYTKAILSRTNQ